MSSRAPIALFAYNRPAHTAQTIASLKACPEAAESPLFVFSDGARTPEAAAAVAETRAVVRQATGSGFGRVSIVEQQVNKGLANSIIAGVTELCDHFGRVIVVEDDLLLSPFFLSFMNDALDRYASDERVMQVAGYMFDADLSDLSEDALFLPFTTSWGWATWKQAWDHFDPTLHGQARLTADTALRHRFDLNGLVDYSGMLERQRLGLVDSWAIRWYLSVFLRDGLVVFPRRSLVRNEGMDGSGVHCGAVENNQQPDFLGHRVTRWPDEVAVSSATSRVVAAIGAASGNRPISGLSQLARLPFRLLQRWGRYLMQKDFK